jgi:hypothetical protein
VSSTQSQPPAGGDPVAQLRHELHEDFTFGAQQREHLELRLIALEEIAASRWPRRWLLRARLGRGLRASVAYVQGRDFEERRLESASIEMTLPDWVRQSLTTPAATVATPAPVSTGVAPDGSATIAAADLGLVLGALADAATCHLAHGGDRTVVPAYRRISLALGDDR